MWESKSLPFVGLPDEKGRVARLYHQKVHLTKLGRMPALFILNKAGIVRYTYYSSSMKDIPRNEDLFPALKFS